MNFYEFNLMLLQAAAHAPDPVSKLVMFALLALLCAMHARRPWYLRHRTSLCLAARVIRSALVPQHACGPSC